MLLMILSLTSLLLVVIFGSSISSHSYNYYCSSPPPCYHHHHNNRLLERRRKKKIIIMPSSSSSLSLPSSSSSSTITSTTRLAASATSSAVTSSSQSSSSGGDNDNNNINNISKSKKKSRVYNFTRGHPNYVPTKEMKDLMKRVIADAAGGGGDDGDDTLLLSRSLTYLPNDQGQPELLKELGSFLERHTRNDDLGDTGGDGNNNSNVNSSQLFITNGVSHGLDLLCATQTQPGDLVLVERPSYFLAYDIFTSHNLNMEGLPMMMKMKTTTTYVGDGDGGGYQIDIDALRTRLEEDSTTKPKPRMIYVIPTHQNPTGCTMSCETRQQLAELSAKYNILIVADEVYHLLDWSNDSETSGSKKPARMVLYNTYVDEDTGRSSQCVSVSSFTKIFSPGIRCGWIETSSTAIIDKLCEHGYIRSGGACQPFVGALMCTALKQGIVDTVLSNLIESYQRKCQLLCETLRLVQQKATATSEGAEDGEPLLQFMEPCGGYFVWVQLPVNSQEFLEYCSRCRGEDDDKVGVQLQFLPGHRCDYLPPKDDGEVEQSSSAATRQLTWDISRSVRLCLAYMNDEDLVEGAKYFVASLREYMNNGMKRGGGGEGAS